MYEVTIVVAVVVNFCLHFSFVVRHQWRNRHKSNVINKQDKVDYLIVRPQNMAAWSFLFFYSCTVFYEINPDTKRYAVPRRQLCLDGVVERANNVYIGR